jgi:hypothetical protein
VHLPPYWIAFALLLTGTGAPPLAAGEALSEDGYRTAATGWQKSWNDRHSITSRKEDDCIAAWQQGDSIRESIAAVTPPERFAEYHDLLLTCVQAALDTSDECLLKPRGGPEWWPKFRAALDKQKEILKLVREQKLDLPTRW